MTERRKLKVFFLEDNPDDVELELHELRRGGFDVTSEVARNRKEFLEKLTDLDADIIIADYALPDITGIEAIHICQEKNIDAPIIFITGVGDELLAVESLREGAIDYILKKNIIGLPGRVSRVLEIWADRKAKEQADAERQRLQELLFQAQKIESIGRLAGGIAHDFNNILTGILGFTHLCLEDMPPGSQDYGRMRTIITLCERGADLTRQLLIFSRRMPMEPKRIDLNFFIEETMHFIRPMVEESVEIKLNLQKGIPEIKVDAGHLTQVLMNLAVNARDAMKNVGVLEFRTETYHLPEDFPVMSQDAKKRDYVCLSVSDTGRGIPEEDIPKIFDPFFTTKEVGKGTGLGLAIVYSVVNTHEGWIDVNSKLGEGTTFKIYLPAIQPELSEISAPAGEAEREKIMISRRDETILIVEDDDTLRTLCATTPNRLGYNVLSARDGEEALEIYRNEAKKIDLIISDMVMPKKSGMEVFNELKAINPDIKFIIVTGYGICEQIEHIPAEMNAVITKPYEIHKMAHLIREILDKEGSRKLRIVK
ncbi:MAG: response regulator [Nitrospirae bacterium]|nr:response regulator [Nitrospirota bacterium]